MKAMPKKVALVGHCGADTSYLRMAIMTVSRDLQVLVAHDETSLQKALNDGIDLVLPNRILDWGFPEDDGVALIRRLSASHDGHAKIAGIRSAVTDQSNFFGHGFHTSSDVEGSE